MHEVAIDNQDVGSVICWDFDVMRYDVVYTLFLVNPPRDSKPTGGVTASSGDWIIHVIQKLEPF